MTTYAQDRPEQDRPHTETETFALADCTVHVQGTSVETLLPSGRRVLGMPMHDASYRATANRLGYGTNVARLNVEHELSHGLLAHWLGLPCSPVFQRIAGGDHEPDDLTRAEEAAVMAVQAYAVALGVDLIEVARRWGQA
jgi:hypothetical protein